MTNEVQRFDILGNPGSGKFTLAFRDVPTGLLAYHPAAGDVQRALEALSTVGIGNVAVNKDGNWSYVCAFQNDLGDQDLPLLKADDSQLGGGGTIQVSVVTEGEGGIGGFGSSALAMPCSVQDLSNWMRLVSIRAPGLTTMMIESSSTVISLVIPTSKESK